MGKGATTGKQFLEGILSKITDPERRKLAEQVFADAVVQTEVGNGVEGQTEIDRQLQTLTASREELTTRQAELDARDAGLQSWHADLSKWHGDSKDLLEDGKRFRASGKTLKPGDPGYVAPTAELPKGVMTEDQFKDVIGGERAAFLGFSRDQNLITREHYARFNEIVDLEPLLKHPKIAEVGLLGVYELVHKDRLAAHADAAKQKAEEAIRLDERQKTQAAMAQMPYPSVTGAGSGSPLDALETGKKDSVVDAAAAHYQRIQAERAGAPAAAAK